MSPVLVMLMSRSGSDFERSSIRSKENKTDGVDPNHNVLDCYIRKKEGKALWYSAVCDYTIKRSVLHQHCCSVNIDSKWYAGCKTNRKAKYEGV